MDSAARANCRGIGIGLGAGSDPSRCGSHHPKDGLPSVLLGKGAEKTGTEKRLQNPPTVQRYNVAVDAMASVPSERGRGYQRNALGDCQGASPIVGPKPPSA